MRISGATGNCFPKRQTGENSKPEKIEPSGNGSQRPVIYLMDIMNAENLSMEYCTAHFPRRTEKALKFRFPDDRYRCLCAGVLLHEILGLEETEIRFNEYGKPFSESMPGFSLSHSGKYAVLATGSTPVGVDIEQAERDYLDLMPQIFTDEEIIYVGNELNRFYTLWTLKESLLKAAGLGLGMEMKGLSVLPLLLGNSVPCLGKNWYGSSRFIDGGHYALSYVSEIKEYPDIVRFSSYISMG